VEFITTKHFLSEYVAKDRKNLKKLYDKMIDVKKIKAHAYITIKGCYVYAKKMSGDSIKSGYIVTRDKVNDYLNFNGYYTRLNQAKTTNDFTSEKDKKYCTPFLTSLQRFFKRQTDLQPVCSVGN